MVESSKTEEFLKKLAPCIERGELEACVEEAARVAREMGIGAGELLELSAEKGKAGGHALAYVLALAAAQGLDGEKKARAYFIAGLAAEFLNNLEKAEKHYQEAIKINPNYAQVHNNYGILLTGIKRFDEAEKQFQEAIKADPNLAEAHYNYANLLLEGLNRKSEAEEHYKKAIEANPNYAQAHYNYAFLLEELNRKDEAEKQYQEAIKINPNYAQARSNYGILLQELNRKDEAEEQYKQAIAADPMFANAHGAYGLLLIEYDRRDEAWKETEKASNIFKEEGRNTQSHLAKAWFYEQYSKKNLDSKNFLESSEDANKAGEEYLKAAQSADGDLKDNLTLLGCELKAKSFVRKIPVQSWYKKLLYKLGKNPDIPALIDNLKNAASWYEKASQCPVDAKKDVCNACHIATGVFSEALDAMSAFMKGKKAVVNKDNWDNSLDFARKIYEEKKKDTGIIFVDTLKQLTKCVNELAEHQVTGLKPQEDRLRKCYFSLIKVSENLDGALKLLTEHAVVAMTDYAKKQGMSGFVREKTKKSFLEEWKKEIVAAIIFFLTTALMDWIFSLNLFSKLFNLIKSTILGMP